MQIETERLLIVALTPRQLALWIDDIEQLEQEMQCTYRAEPMTGVFREIVRGQLERIRENESDYLWLGFWFLVRKSERTVVGAAGFKNVPNDRGEVEIGYGLGKDFRHRGYMTETVHVLCNWAREQPDVAHVVAETEPGNRASQRILLRCGFEVYARGETIKWRL